MNRVVVLLLLCAAAVASVSVRADEQGTAAAKYGFWSGPSFRTGEGADSHGLVAGVMVSKKEPLRPIAWFGAAKSPGGKSRYLYLLIFKTPLDLDASGALSFSVSGRGSSQQGVAGSMAMKLGTKMVRVDYDFRIDPMTETALERSLTIGEQELKDGGPRVFIVDLTGEAVTYTPLNVELPNDAPDVGTEQSDEWGAIVQRSVDRLGNESAELRKLLNLQE